MEFNFRNVLAFFFAGILIALGFVKRAKKRALNGDYILSVYFHSPSKKMFESIIQWFLKNDFHFISVKELDLILKKESDFPKGAVLLTIDDGWISNEENIVSVADKYKIPVTIFVSTEPVENGIFWWSYISQAMKEKWINQTIEYFKKIPNIERLKIVRSLQQKIFLRRQAMTIEQLQRIAASKYITIGGHSVTHPILTNCDDFESFNEIKKSKLQLEDWLQTDIKTFAFPNGDFSEREVSYLKQLNFRLGFTTKEVYLTKERLCFNYLLPRFYIYENASLSENICRMTGAWINKKSFAK